MSQITVTLPEERLRQLQELAGNCQLSVEELVRASIEDFLSGTDEAVAAAVKLVLEKNRELYRRLA